MILCVPSLLPLPPLAQGVGAPQNEGLWPKERMSLKVLTVAWCVLVLSVTAASAPAQWDRNPAEQCGGLDGFAGTLRGCLSKQLPPGSPDTLPWCGLSEHLITLISCSVQSSRLADKHTEAEVFLENRSFLPALPRVLQRLPPAAPSLAPSFYLCLLSEVEGRQYNLASKQLKLTIFFCNLRKSVSVEEQVPGTSCCPGTAPYAGHSSKSSSSSAARMHRCSKAPVCRFRG